jgi:putative alpha-1,2-mannosidase
MNPASGEYVVGSPIFDRVDISFPQSDHVTTITASGAGDKMYVKGLRLDGKEVTAPRIAHSDLIRVKNLDFDMSSEPQTWGVGTI